MKSVDLQVYPLEEAVDIVKNYIAHRGVSNEGTISSLYSQLSKMCLEQNRQDLMIGVKTHLHQHRRELAKRIAPLAGG